jgi:hypothetical protein
MLQITHRSPVTVNINDHQNGNYIVTYTIQGGPTDSQVRCTTAIPRQADCAQPVPPPQEPVYEEEVQVAVQHRGQHIVGSPFPVSLLRPPQTRQMRAIGSNGSGEGNFVYPYGLHLDGDLLYVADKDNHRVQVRGPGGRGRSQSCSGRLTAACARPPSRPTRSSTSATAPLFAR